MTTTTKTETIEGTVAEYVTAVIGGHALIGAQPYQAFEQLMKVCEVKRRQDPLFPPRPPSPAPV